ncbi:MAG: glutaredoxin [Sedimenticola sp.]|nr:glutaredoxin [Sedimenticola sp.]
MALIRWILGRLILLIDYLTSPRGIERPAGEQALLDQETGQLALYQFQACPFCVKVRRFLKRNSLNIETRDARRDPRYRQEMLEQAGQVKVPCLRIAGPQGEVRWLFESDEIIQYLESRFLQPERVSPQSVSGD